MSAMISSWSRVPGTSGRARAADAGRAGEAATDRVAGRHRAGAPSRVAVVHELLEHAALDEHVAARREALAVDVGRRVGERVRRVVDERDERGRHRSPRRSRNRLRPLTTASPLSVEEITPRNWAVTNGSSTTVRRLLAGLVAPSSRVARSTASRAALSRSKQVGSPADGEPEPGLGLVAVVGQRADARRSTRSPDPTRGCRSSWPPRPRRTRRRSWRRRRGCARRRPSVRRSSSLASSILRSVGNAASVVVPQRLRR